MLVSIHSDLPFLGHEANAVKDLCWCQSTAGKNNGDLQHVLSKICAGVNPQPKVHVSDHGPGCQRSVLVSIHSKATVTVNLSAAVKDLCWCQSTAIPASVLARPLLSKICAGVNPQPEER